MSTPSESTLTTDFPCDPQPSTTTADNVGKEQHDVPKSTVEQDTAVDDSLLGSLNAKISSKDRPAPTSDGSSPPTNAAPGADLPVPEIPVALSQGADDGEVWIPKGNGARPNGAPTKPTKPARPSKPKRDD